MEKVECKHCGKKFGNSQALNQHINSKHAQTESVKQKPVKIKSSKIAVYGIILLAVAGIVYGVYWSISSKSSIGAVGSTHIHADLSIVLDGKQITPFSVKYYVRSPYVHVESGPGAGYVVHIHATGVPLGMFIKSLGMGLDENCFTYDTGVKYCNDGKTVKMFVKNNNGEWKKNYDFGNYVFESLDKILISYGNETDEELQQQMEKVTDFAKVESM